MAFLWKREQDENELTYDARAVIHGVANGKSEADAAVEAGIEEDDLRRWKRDPVFRAALRRARREGPREPHFWPWNEPDARPPSPFPAPGTSNAQVEAEIRRTSWRRLR